MKLTHQSLLDTTPFLALESLYQNQELLYKTQILSVGYRFFRLQVSDCYLIMHLVPQSESKIAIQSASACIYA